MERTPITLRFGVVGDDGTDWLPGETHLAGVRFARELVARGAALPVGDLPPAGALTTAEIAAASVPVTARDPQAPAPRRGRK